VKAAKVFSHFFFKGTIVYWILEVVHVFFHGFITFTSDQG
jgi:hypothetical protein